MYRILIVSEDFVLRKAVAFSLNDLDACVECADTVFVISWPQSEQMVRSIYRMGVNQYMTLPVSLHRLRRKVINELIDREKWK